MGTAVAGWLQLKWTPNNFLACTASAGRPAVPRTHPCPCRYGAAGFCSYGTKTRSRLQNNQSQRREKNNRNRVLDRKFGLTNTQILAILDRQRACNFNTKMASCVKMSDLDRTSTTLGQLSPRNIAVYAYVRIRICVHAFTYVRLVLKNESLRSIRPSIDFFFFEITIICEFHK